VNIISVFVLKALHFALFEIETSGLKCAILGDYKTKHITTQWHTEPIKNQNNSLKTILLFNHKFIQVQLHYHILHFIVEYWGEKTKLLHDGDTIQNAYSHIQIFQRKRRGKERSLLKLVMKILH
jgi:hypothetical protein